MKYKLKSGVVVTGEDIEDMVASAERGELPGEWTGEVIVGRPRLSDERLITVPVKFPASVVAQIDKVSKNRSDFIRKAVAAYL